MSGDKFDGFALVDWERTVHLCDVGMPGHVIAVAVTDDGRDTLWIVDEEELHAEDPRHGNGDQPHEWTGALPERWRHRVALAPYRCGRRTKTTGRPCRIEVSAPGRACGLHSEGRVMS
jgi:hypothetical protein